VHREQRVVAANKPSFISGTLSSQVCCFPVVLNVSEEPSHSTMKRSYWLLCTSTGEAARASVQIPKRYEMNLVINGEYSQAGVYMAGYTHNVKKILPVIQVTQNP
jgi:hypothetical protein